MFNKTTILICSLTFLITSSALASDLGVMGKNGETTPLISHSHPQAPSVVTADVMFNSAGAMDTPATQGGDYEGWGTHFLSSWTNTTGQDITVVEFGWPCGGFWARSWYVWISENLPGAPGSQDFQGTFLAASEDETEYPPSLYTYVDVAEEGIIIPAGSTMFFGYGNPGMGGQIYSGPTETWSWYEEAWDSDSEYNRTAILQFKGNFIAPTDVGSSVVTMMAHPEASPNPFNPRTTISFELPNSSTIDLKIHDLRGQLIKTLKTGTLESGHHEFLWDGTNNYGRALSSGAYFVRLKTDQGLSQRKITLVR